MQFDDSQFDDMDVAMKITGIKYPKDQNWNLARLDPLTMSGSWGDRIIITGTHEGVRKTITLTSTCVYPARTYMRFDRKLMESIVGQHLKKFSLRSYEKDYDRSGRIDTQIYVLETDKHKNIVITHDVRYKGLLCPNKRFGWIECSVLTI